MTDRTLTDGSPVPEDGSHREIDPATGMQKGYIVLSAEERAKGFVKPVRDRYVHSFCGNVTTMARSLAETYARNPRFYSGTFCATCRTHFPLDEYNWLDGEPMDPDLHAGWEQRQAEVKAQRRLARIEALHRELAELEAQS